MFSKETIRYPLYGAGIGLCLAGLGTLCLGHSEFGNISLSSLASVQNKHYVLWILDTSPLWLGMLGWFAGLRQEDLVEQNRGLNNRLTVQEKNEDRQSNLLDNILDIAANEIFICSLPDLKITHVSGAIIQNLGYSQNDLIGLPLYELFEDLDRKQLEALIEPLLKGSFTPIKLSCFQKKKDGTPHPSEFELTVDSPSSPEVLTGIAGKLSNQSIYKKALQSERKKFFDILENLPIAFHLQASDYSVPYGNKLFRESFGPPTIKPCYELMHKRTAPCEICQPFKVFTTQEEITSIWTSPEGKTYLTMCTPYQDIDQTPLVMEMALDITELEQAKKTAIKALNKVQKTNEAKSDFLTLMNQELRAPLNAFLEISQLLSLNSGSLSVEHQKNLRHILKEGNNLLGVFNKVLDMIHKESGNIPFIKSTFNINSVIDELFLTVQPLAEKRELSLQFISENSETEIYSDELRIKQILLNLLSNAIRFNKAGGSVTARISKQDPENIKIDIEDTGIGIQENRLTTIFEAPTENMDHSDFNRKGTGLGLSTTKCLSELLGGTIQVTSKFGEGSVFSLELPTSRVETSIP